MKKFFNAQFLLECIIADGDDQPVYELRDRNGQIAVLGSIQDVIDFLDQQYKLFCENRSKSSEKGD